MAKINSRAKGQRGEREAATVLQGIVDQEWMRVHGIRSKDPVVEGQREKPSQRPVLTRNLVQTRNGGHDLVGLDWLALEIKFCETLQLDAWWNQTKRQASEHETVVNQKVMPVLMYRQSRKPWRIQMLGKLPGLSASVRVDISLEAFSAYFRAECRKHFAIPSV